MGRCRSVARSHRAGAEHVSSSPGTIHVRGRRPARAAIDSVGREPVAGPPRDGPHARSDRSAPAPAPLRPRSHDRPLQMTEPVRTVRERPAPPASTSSPAAALVARQGREIDRHAPPPPSTVAPSTAATARTCYPAATCTYHGVTVKPHHALNLLLVPVHSTQSMHS